MVVQKNMHPQVVEEVKAGKPDIFSPHPKNVTQETAYGWKVEKTFKNYLERKGSQGKAGSKIGY